MLFNHKEPCLLALESMTHSLYFCELNATTVSSAMLLRNSSVFLRIKPCFSHTVLFFFLNNLKKFYFLFFYFKSFMESNKHMLRNVGFSIRSFGY